MVLHSALFRYSDTESQLASVMAHEYSHATQRPPWRARWKTRLTLRDRVGALGSILLAMASPQAGMAVLSRHAGRTQQGMMSFTRQNEEEADRIGIQVLQRSGFIASHAGLYGKAPPPVALLIAATGKLLPLTPCPKAVCPARTRANQMRPAGGATLPFLFR
ncbi:M48 family metalloprotease [Shigella flexneri]